MDYKILYVILDGLGDRPNKDFYGKTPLEAAKKPVLDKMAKFAECGLHYPYYIGNTVESDEGHFALFSYPKKYLVGRGIYEALGENIDLKEGDLAFRANIATISTDGIIIDRRAGRIDFGFENIISDFNKEVIPKLESKYGVKIIVKRGVEHRLAVVLRGENLSDKIATNDPHKIGVKAPKFKAIDDSAKKIEEILNDLVNEFYNFAKDHPINKEREKKGLLPANYLLLRGPGLYKELPKGEQFPSRYNVDAIFLAGAPMYLGIAKYVGMDVYKPIGATGTVNTSLVSKAEAAIEKSRKYDLVFVHIKATDSLSHDKKPKDKKKFIERIDEHFFKRVIDSFDIIVVTGDHTTSSIHGEHKQDPVPFMVHSTNLSLIRKDSVKKFGERWCYKGIWGLIESGGIIRSVLNR